MQVVDSTAGEAIPPGDAHAPRQPGTRRQAALRRVSCLLYLMLSMALFALAPASTVLADSQSTLARVGFVDIPYLIDRAPQALDAERRLESEFEPRQRELEGQRADLARMTAQLADSRTELGDTELAQLDREARALERRIRRAEQDFREELNIEKNNEFKKVRVLVLEAIAEFGKRENYDLIVSDGVLFAHPRVDVTERILDSLEREFARLQSAN